MSNDHLNQAGAMLMRRLRLAAYLACAWAFLFAAMSFYWALGGTVGLESLGTFADSAQSDSPSFIVFVWITALLKVFAGLFALALIRPWGRFVPHWMRLATWPAGILLALYGAALLIQHGLMAVGVIDIPAGLGRTALPWHLLVWDPFWLLGGILFALAGWYYRQTTRVLRAT